MLVVGGAATALGPVGRTATGVLVDRVVDECPVFGRSSESDAGRDGAVLDVDPAHAEQDHGCEHLQTALANRSASGRNQLLLNHVIGQRLACEAKPGQPRRRELAIL